MIAQGMKVGHYLQEQREKQGIPLEAVSRRTRINSKHLQALENGEFDDLPCETFIRGFLRSYAKFLNLDQAEVMAAYLRQKESEDSGKPIPPPMSAPFKRTKSFFYNFFATMIGAAPAFSLNKAVLPPKR